jgi:hypothetical protein
MSVCSGKNILLIVTVANDEEDVDPATLTTIPTTPIDKNSGDQLSSVFVPILFQDDESKSV